MIKKIFKLIHDLKIFFLALIIVWFLFILGLNPVSITKLIGAKISSAVGFSVGVKENSFNKLALQLQEKEKRLVKKEETLERIEAELKKRNSLRENKLVLIMILGIVILFILILLNYYFDYKKRKSDLKNNK